jgi:FkbM family methyltransferase
VRDEARAKLKTIILTRFGENYISWIHAVRYVKISKLQREPEIRLLKHYLKLGDIGVDVGANGGDWTSRMGQAVGATGLVLAFEADPYYAKVTDRALRLRRFKNIRFFSYGLSDTEYEGRLVVDVGDGTRTSGLGYIDAHGDVDKSVSVRLRPFDEVVAELKLDPKRIRLMKIDVEGHESAVLRGSLGTIKSALPIIVAEINAPNATSTAGREEVLELLGSLGYKPHALRSGALVPFDPLQPNHNVYNVVFVPDT